MVNINRIRGLKFICLECKAEWTVPLTGGGKIPERCIYCGRNIPHLYAQRCLDELAATQEVLRKAKIEVVIVEEEK